MEERGMATAINGKQARELSAQEDRELTENELGQISGGLFGGFFQRITQANAAAKRVE
jgi:bacteriocin-like protein